MNTTLLSEVEYQQYLAEGEPEPDGPAHPLCAGIRALRKSAGLSLAQFEHRSGIKAVVVGAYERGDRIPPLSKLEAIYRFFGYQITALPVGADRVRLTVNMVADLRAMADQLERRDAPITTDGTGDSFDAADGEVD